MILWNRTSSSYLYQIYGHWWGHFRWDTQCQRDESVGQSVCPPGDRQDQLPGQQGPRHHRAGRGLQVLEGAEAELGHHDSQQQEGQGAWKKVYSPQRNPHATRVAVYTALFSHHEIYVLWFKSFLMKCFVIVKKGLKESFFLITRNKYLMNGLKNCCYWSCLFWA